MKVFLDTSSLLKLYHREDGTDKLLQLLSDKAKSIYLSELAKVEFTSAVSKKVRTKELTNITANKIISYFETDFDKFIWIKLNTSIINSAKEYIKIYGNNNLRTLDAIQLACALSVKNNMDIFIIADKVLAKIFRFEKLPTDI